MISSIASYIKKHGLINEDDRLAVGSSGGPDSQLLVYALGKLGYKNVHVISVDHNLRPESKDEVKLAGKLAKSFGFMFTGVSIHFDGSRNVMQNARDERYKVIYKIAKQHDRNKLALGHHADDKAETVLMRILRGSGPNGLSVMPPMNKNSDENITIIRPILHLRKDQIQKYLDDVGVEYAIDPSNFNEKYLRSRIRHSILPQLEEISPSVVKHLCNIADDLSEYKMENSIKRSHIEAISDVIKNKKKSAIVQLPGGFVVKYGGMIKR